MAGAVGRGTFALGHSSRPLDTLYAPSCAATPAAPALGCAPADSGVKRRMATMRKEAAGKQAFQQDPVAIIGPK